MNASDGIDPEVVEAMIAAGMPPGLDVPAPSLELLETMRAQPDPIRRDSRCRGAPRGAEHPGSGGRAPGRGAGAPPREPRRSGCPGHRLDPRRRDDRRLVRHGRAVPRPARGENRLRRDRRRLPARAGDALPGRARRLLRRADLPARPRPRARGGRDPTRRGWEQRRGGARGSVRAPRPRPGPRHSCTSTLCTPCSTTGRSRRRANGTGSPSGRAS